MYLERASAVVPLAANLVDLVAGDEASGGLTFVCWHRGPWSDRRPTLAFR
jgi:hypothetical protein